MVFFRRKWGNVSMRGERAQQRMRIWTRVFRICADFHLRSCAAILVLFQICVWENGKGWSCLVGEIGRQRKKSNVWYTYDRSAPIGMGAERSIDLKTDHPPISLMRKAKAYSLSLRRYWWRVSGPQLAVPRPRWAASMLRMTSGRGCRSVVWRAS